MICRFIAACLLVSNSSYIEMLKKFLSKMFFDVIVFSGDTVDKFIK